MPENPNFRFRQVGHHCKYINLKVENSKVENEMFKEEDKNACSEMWLDSPTSKMTDQLIESI